jgi:hypothetical protein
VEIRSPIIEYNVQEAKALEMASAPVTTVKSKNSDKQSLCTMAERFCNGFYSRFEERTHADGKVADCQTAYFAGVIKTYPRRDRWPEYPKQDEGEKDEDYNKRTEDYKSHLGISECFFSDYIPIETVFLDDWNDPDIAVEVKKVGEQELMEEFGLSKSNGDYYTSKPGTDTEGADDRSALGEAIHACIAADLVAAGEGISGDELESILRRMGVDQALDALTMPTGSQPESVASPQS